MKRTTVDSPSVRQILSLLSHWVRCFSLLFVNPGISILCACIVSDRLYIYAAARAGGYVGAGVQTLLTAG